MAAQLLKSAKERLCHSPLRSSSLRSALGRRAPGPPRRGTSGGRPRGRGAAMDSILPLTILMIQFVNGPRKAQRERRDLHGVAVPGRGRKRPPVPPRQGWRTDNS